MGLPQFTSTPSVCCSKTAPSDDKAQSEGQNEAICAAKDVVQGKDGHVTSMPLPLSSSSPLPSSSDINGCLDLKELQSLQPTIVDHMSGERAT